MIENKCKDIKIIYQQLGNKDIREMDVCQPGESQAFTWADPKIGKKKDDQIIQQLEVKFF